MKKLQRITVSEAEQRTLYAAEEVLKTIADRFQSANGGGYYAQLELAAEVKYCAEGYPLVWYTVHPYLEMTQSGHNTVLAAALDEMCGKGESHVKREQAERLRREAERLDDEALKLEEREEGK